MEIKLKDTDKTSLQSEHEIIYDKFSKSKQTQKEKDILISDFNDLLLKYSVKVKIEFI